MTRYTISALLTAAAASFLFAADGCAINPWNTPDIEYGHGGGGATSTASSGGTAGTAGAGGTAGIGGAGGAMTCTCSDDGNACTDDLIGQECPGGDANACHTVVATRQCTGTDSIPGYCDAAGECKSCQECSGAECTKRCNGQACVSNDVCESEFCVDGYCCDSTCEGPCKACNRVPGTCSQLPFGMVGGCSTNQLCGNTGACITQTKAPLGALCTNDVDCQTALCGAQICVSPLGQPCVEHLECTLNLCDPATHTCVSCESGIACPAGAGCLTGGRCQVFPGQPAKNSTGCIPPAEFHDGLTCTLPIGAACTADFECIYRRCFGAPNGTCGDVCASDGDCPPGTTCHPNGGCRLPKGSYCVIDEQCQGPVNKGTCGGFPRRCL